MTKRDYERMVAIIAATWAVSGKGPGVRTTLLDLAQCFAEFAAKDNPRFERGHFLLRVERELT